MPNLYEAEARPERLSPAHRVQRLKQRRRRFAIVTALAVVLVVALAARVWAHTIDLSAGCECKDGKVYVQATVNSQHGDYRFAGTATDSEGHSASVTIAAGGGSTTVQLGPVTDSGSVRVVGDFWKANGDKAEHMDRTARYPFLADCQPTQTTAPPTTSPPPTTGPPTTGPPDTTTPDDNFAGTATDQTRPPSDVEEDTTATPSTPPPGQLPFTGPREDMQRAMLLAGLALVLAGAALVVTMRRKPAAAIEQSWGEARVRPDRDSADANLLATLFGRRGR